MLLNNHKPLKWPSDHQSSASGRWIPQTDQQPSAASANKKQQKRSVVRNLASNTSLKKHLGKLLSKTGAMINHAQNIFL
jgi:hypothetical protein